jgi:hypothetical protein
MSRSLARAATRSSNAIALRPRIKTEDTQSRVSWSVACFAIVVMTKRVGQLIQRKRVNNALSRRIVEVPLDEAGALSSAFS